MVELLNLDTQVFQLINSGWSNSFFDFLLPFLRNKYFWFPLYIFIISFLLINFKKQGLYIIIALSVTVGIADATSSHLIKKNVQRLRPCKIYKAPNEINLLVRCGSGYSFPSSHAANHFSMAVFIFLLIGNKNRWIKWGFIFWALAISYSQVYVGVHYPLDIICGAVLGSLIASFVYFFYRTYLSK
ncbi:MAG: phosphatase PAP2 family protein [Bacteroidota bacterium]